MNYIYLNNSHDAIASAGQHLTSLLHHYISSPILLLVSGGSAFATLEHIAEDVIGKRVTVGILDERFDTNPHINNFCALSSLPFFERAKKAGCTFLDSCVVENESLESFADRFGAMLYAWKEKHPEGKVIVTQGVGEDGHTAGIMPFPEDTPLFSQLFEEKPWVIGYDAGLKNQYPLRVTVTNTFLREVVDHAIVLITGDQKRTVFTKLLKEGGVYAEMPAHILKDMRDVTVCTNLKP